MKISELISKLEEAKNLYGNVELFFIEPIYCDSYDELPLYNIKLTPKVGEYEWWEDTPDIPKDRIKKLWVELE